MPTYVRWTLSAVFLAVLLAVVANEITRYLNERTTVRLVTSSRSADFDGFADLYVDLIRLEDQVPVEILRRYVDNQNLSPTRLRKLARAGKRKPHLVQHALVVARVRKRVVAFAKLIVLDGSRLVFIAYLGSDDKNATQHLVSQIVKRAALRLPPLDFLVYEFMDRDDRSRSRLRHYAESHGGHLFEFHGYQQPSMSARPLPSEVESDGILSLAERVDYYEYLETLADLVSDSLVLRGE
ncbi:MAG: hypothetical protein J0H98_05030 [Solirubrobacterales bacterium]|nr:hypothetical protein [Solirubrobacterales bacterium]